MQTLRDYAIMDSSENLRRSQCHVYDQIPKRQCAFVIHGSRAPAVGGQTSDNKWHVVDASDAKVSFEKNVLTIGDQSYTVNNDTQLHMVVDKDVGIDVSDKVNTDKDADYVVYDDVNGAEMRATLDGCAITGTYYVVLEKDWKDGNNGALDYLFLHVDGASKSSDKDVTDAKAALGELGGDDAIPSSVIPEDVENDSTEALDAIKNYIANEVKRVAKSVDYEIVWPANSNYTAPTDAADLDTPGTQGSYTGVKVKITKENGDVETVNLADFKIDPKPYQAEDDELVADAKDKVDNMTKSLDMSEVDAASAAAARKAAEDAVIEELGGAPAARAAAEELPATSTRQTASGLTLTFTWGEFQAPTQPESEGSSNAADGHIKITKLVIEKGKEKQEITETITFSIPALDWADTEAGQAEAAIEEALTAAETAITAGMENAESLTIMDNETSLQVDAVLTEAAAAIKTAVEALIEDENITVTVTAKVTTAVNGDTAGAFTATVTLTYGDEADGNTKDVTLTGVIEKYVAAT